MGDGIRNFNPEFLKPLYESFIVAWADHEPRIDLSYDMFVQRIRDKLNIHGEVSLLKIRKSQIIGFILHTINEYRGQLCAYNGGTGVVPAARGEGITKELYQHLIPILKSHGVPLVILEAEKNNPKAIHIYLDIGFRIITEFRCYAKRGFFQCDRKISCKIVNNFNPDYKEFWDLEPSFLDQPQQLEYNQHNELILESEENGIITGYIIFQPQLGRISQLAVNPDYRRKGIGKALIFEAFQRTLSSGMTIMNIPSTNTDFNDFLKKVGFINEIDQYEMQMIID